MVEFMEYTIFCSDYARFMSISAFFRNSLCCIKVY